MEPLVDGLGVKVKTEVCDGLVENLGQSLENGGWDGVFPEAEQFSTSDWQRFRYFPHIFELHTFLATVRPSLDPRCDEHVGPIVRMVANCIDFSHFMILVNPQFVK